MVPSYSVFHFVILGGGGGGLDRGLDVFENSLRKNKP